MSQQIDDSLLPASPTPGFEYANGGIEYPQNGFSRRERAAIDLCIPQSGTPWLDDMIREAQRQRFAGMALKKASRGSDRSADEIARRAYYIADAMLAARKGGAE